MPSTCQAVASAPVVITNAAFHLRFTSDGYPSSLIRLADGVELLNARNPGEGFEVMGLDSDSFLSKGARLDHLAYDGTNLTAWSGTMRCTFRVHTGERHVSFYLIRVEGIPKANLHWLRFRFNTTGPVALHPLDEMTFNYPPYHESTDEGGRDGAREVRWRWLWDRNDANPLGGFALHVPQDDVEHDETLLHIWTEESLPHPAGAGAWTVERARVWLADWQHRYADIRKMTIEGDRVEDLTRLVDLAAEQDINCIKLFSHAWSGVYWPVDRPAMEVNSKLFPGGEPDFKKLCDYIHGKGMGIDIHTLSMSIGPRDPAYVLRDDGPDPRLANWIHGTLSAPVSEGDTTLLFVPAPGQEFPSQVARIPVGPSSVPFFMYLHFMRLGQEMIEVGAFADTDRPVWTLKNCRRGRFSTKTAAHPAGEEVVGYSSPYGQAFTAASNTTLLEELARAYAEFCNRNGITHIELDGLEVHADVPYGPAKFARAVYRHLDHPVTSGTSSGGPMPFHIEYWFKGSRGMGGRQTATMPLMLEQPSRRATSPYEVHTRIAQVAAKGGSIGGMGNPEPMFSLSTAALDGHGLSRRFLEQLNLWRIAARNMTSDQRREILHHYTHMTSLLGQDVGNDETRVVYGIERRGADLALTPFALVERPGIEVAWGQGQEFGPIVPWQYVTTGETIAVSNRFARQEPQVVIHVLPAPNMAEARDVQPSAAVIQKQGDHVFRDTGDGVEIVVGNPRREPMVNTESLPCWSIPQQPGNLQGIGLTVEGDDSGAVLVVQLRGGGMRDYAIPLDFKGTKDVFIPDGTVSWTDRRWRWRFDAKSMDMTLALVQLRMGFGYVPPGSRVQARVRNLRLLPEMPSRLVNPVLQIGDGKLEIHGTIPSDRYLWFTGGDTITVCDPNWNELERLPVTKSDFVVPSGECSYRVAAESAAPAQMLAVQLLTSGEPLMVKGVE